MWYYDGVVQAKETWHVTPMGQRHAAPEKPEARWGGPFELCEQRVAREQVVEVVPPGRACGVLPHGETAAKEKAAGLEVGLNWHGGEEATVSEGDADLTNLKANHNELEELLSLAGFPTTLHEALAGHPEKHVRRVVADNAWTPPAVLAHLARDREPMVRLAVARNPRTPADTLAG